MTEIAWQQVHSLAEEVLGVTIIAGNETGSTEIEARPYPERKVL
jgi:hypothetical protein